MARVNEATTIPTTTRPSIRGEFTRYGRRWSSSITQLIALSVELDDSGEWALDGSPTCAHWIGAMLDIEIGTAREWLRIGRALAELPTTSLAFANGDLSFTKVRSLTRVATAANEAELLEIAERTPAGDLGRALAAWSARNEDEHHRDRRHRRDRGLHWRTEPDGMVTASLRMTPEQAGRLFNDFTRIKNEKTRNILGSGLGLSIAWEIVKRHDGRIEVVSSPGLGSTFTIALPIAPRATDAGAA